MAVLTIQSDQIVAHTPAINAEPQMNVERIAKLRTLFFNVPATSVTAAGDIGSVLELCRIPYSRIRLFPCLSRYTVSAWGASRTLKFGTRSYTTEGNVTVAEDFTSYNATGLDVSAAVAAQTLSPLLKYDLFSRAGITFAAQVSGGTIPVGATLSGVLVYAAD